MTQPAPSEVPLFGSEDMIPVRVGMLFRLSAHLGTSVLVDRESDASAISAEFTSLVVYYAGVDLDPHPDDADQHELIRRLRGNERARLRRRGVDPMQQSAEVSLTVVDHPAAGSLLDSDVVRGSFGAQIDRVRGLEDQPGYENVELLSCDELAVPPSAEAPLWAWAVFRYRAIYRSGDVDPHDRFLHLATTSVGNALTHVLYNYSCLLPSTPSFNVLSLFLFEWRYSIVRAIEGRPPIPVEGDPGDPYWADTEQELRTAVPPTPSPLHENGPDELDLLRLGSKPDPEYSPPETDALALMEAYFPDLRNPHRHTTHHELAHAVEYVVAREMKLDLSDSGSDHK
jgi:hypothetical protein